MARPKRWDFEGAIYLVSLRGYSGGHVFYDPQMVERFLDNPRNHAPDAECFESLLWDMCEQYDARIHAYVMEPNSALIVIQRQGAPLSWIVHDLLARYSMHLVEQKRIPEGERPFPRRYKAQIVQPAKLPYAVRYVQRRESGPDPRRRAINHPFSSHLIYCGRRRRPNCFVVSAMREALENLGYLGPTAYFEFMAAGDSPSIAHMLSRRVIGEGSFAKSVSERCRRPPRVPSPDELLSEVTGTLLHTESVIAHSSTHRGALARALVAWYAMRTGAAQIGAVARWFEVTSSDLRYLIRRHRQKHPEHFSKSLPELFPTLFAPQAMPPAQLRELTRPGAAGTDP
jgi:hypothetical protein